MKGSVGAFFNMAANAVNGFLNELPLVGNALDTSNEPSPSTKKAMDAQAKELLDKARNWLSSSLKV